MFVAVLVVILLIAGVGGYVWKIRYAADNPYSADLPKAISALPSQFMQLEPAVKRNWLEQKRLLATELELKKIGANHIGYFGVDHGSSHVRMSLWDFRSQALVVCCERQAATNPNNARYIVDVICRYDGGSLTISSCDNAVLANRPEHHPIYFNKSALVVDALKTIKTNLPAGKRLLKISDVRAFYLDNYEEIAEWSWRPEQLTNNKTQIMLTAAGIDVSKGFIDELIDLGRAYSIDVYTKRVKNKLVSNAKINPEQWQKIRDQVVVIHSLMGVEELSEAIYTLVGQLSVNQEKLLDDFQSENASLVDPLPAFQRLLQSMNIKVRRLAKMDLPVKAEVYLHL